MMLYWKFQGKRKELAEIELNVARFKERKKLEVSRTTGNIPEGRKGKMR